MARWYDYAMPIIPLTREIGRRTGINNLFRNPDSPAIPAPQQLDISSELAMIDEMYAGQKTQTQQTLNQQLKEQQGVTAQSLAGRGVYSSPVSEYSFGANRKSYAAALADALAKLSSEQIGRKAQLSAGAKQFNLSSQEQYNRDVYNRDLEERNRTIANRQALSNALLSTGTALLTRGVYSGQGLIPQNTSQPLPLQPLDRQPRY